MAYRSEIELSEALSAGELVESERLDLKRDMPPPNDRGTKAIATDLAAFALDGGEVIVGVDEGPPVTLTPIALAGQRERIEQVARHRVDPPVVCTVTEIPSETEGRGYLIIEIPASHEAPHAVDEAFYGRFGTTNSRLSAAEVRRLMQGEAGSGPAISDLLEEFVAADPTPADQRRQAHIFIVANPVDTVPALLQDAVGPEWETWTRRAIVDGGQHLEPQWSPDVGSVSRFERVPDGWIATADDGAWRSGEHLRETHWLDVTFGENGSVRVFSGRASDVSSKGRVIMEVIIGGTVRRATEAAIAVVDATGYQGRWDIGVAVTNMDGAVSFFRSDNWWVDREDLPAYRSKDYRRTWSGTTSELRNNPDAVVERLVGPLNRTLNDGRLQLPRPPHRAGDSGAAD